jgi:hypothetical protein
LVDEVASSVPPIEYDDCKRETIVSVASASASASPGEAREQLGRWPGPLGEDTESFAVALAAILNHLTVAFARGISNQAGSRDQRARRVTDALEAATAVAVDLYGEVSQGVAS